MEVTMRRVRIQKQKVRSPRPMFEEILPLDPRDPDVVRAKRLQRAVRTAPRTRAA
jgi:hypothetical protein